MPAWPLPPDATVLLTDGVVVLTPLEPADSEGLWAAGQADDIGQYTSIAWPFTREAAGSLIEDARRDWDHGLAARFAIRAVADAERPVLGTISLLHIYAERHDAELAYWMGIAGRGRGLGRRAALLVRDWAFAEIGLRRLHAMVDFDNDASRSIAEAAGFVRIADTTWTHPTDPTKNAELMEFELLAPVWETFGRRS